MHWNMSDIRFDGFSFSIYDCCLCASLYLFACIQKIAEAFFFFVPSNENKCSKYDRSFPKCDECKMWFFVFNVNDEQRLDFTKTYNNSFRFHPFSMQHRIFTVYVCVYMYIYYINCRCMIVLFCLPWLFWSAEDNVRATFCLIYTHIHTNTYKWRTENYFGL